ncbi:unnamed protein product, partial [Prorocentrum cordatum]
CHLIGESKRTSSFTSLSFCAAGPSQQRRQSCSEKASVAVAAAPGSADRPAGPPEGGVFGFNLGGNAGVQTGDVPSAGVPGSKKARTDGGAEDMFVDDDEVADPELEPVGAQVSEGTRAPAAAPGALEPGEARFFFPALTSDFRAAMADSVAPLEKKAYSCVVEVEKTEKVAADMRQELGELLARVGVLAHGRSGGGTGSATAGRAGEESVRSGGDSADGSSIGPLVFRTPGTRGKLYVLVVSSTRKVWSSLTTCRTRCRDAICASDPDRHADRCQDFEDCETLLRSRPPSFTPASCVDVSASSDVDRPPTTAAAPFAAGAVSWKSDAFREMIVCNDLFSSSAWSEPLAGRCALPRRRARGPTRRFHWHRRGLASPILRLPAPSLLDMDERPLSIRPSLFRQSATAPCLCAECRLFF